MGTVFVKLKIPNPENGTPSVEVDDAVLDTGSIHTVLPTDVALKAGLRKVSTRNVLTASGPQTLDQSYAFLELQGQGIMFPVLISNTLRSTLVGVTLLEILGFIVDPIREEIRETDVLLL
jgi:predicted aspartyl protease